MPARVALNLRESGAVFPCKWCSVAEIYKYKSEPHAYIKMWKHHAALDQADRLLDAAKSEEVPWLKQFGGYISGEHFLPKVAQIADEAPTIFQKADRIVELGDWLVWQLTGVESRNYCATAFKAYFSRKRGDVSKSMLEKVNPLLGKLCDKLSDNVVMPGNAVGGLSEKAAKQTGLNQGTPVSAAIIDAHATCVGSKKARAGDMLLIIGTSACVIMQSDRYCEVGGISGVVPEGIVPGLNAYEGGQAAVGDLFAWYCDHCVPVSYYNEAQQRNISIHQLLTEKAALKTPGESGIIALDWINGVRSTLMDFDLSGLVCGMTLETKPEDIYRALIEATAFGAWKIVSQLIENGIEINHVYASGGIPLKNEMLAQIYADVFNMDISVIDDPYLAAHGSAILGLAASEGGFRDLDNLMARYKSTRDIVYHPIKKNVEIYHELYDIYSELYEQFGKQSSILKKLKTIRGRT